MQAASAAAVTLAEAQIESILDARHRTDVDTRDFTVTNSATFLNAAKSITDIFTVLLGSRRRPSPCSWAASE